MRSMANSSNQLVSSSKDRLSERLSFISSFKEISLKEGITSNNTYSHKINNSSEMSIASFRDSTCALEFAGLKDTRINPCVGNERLMGREIRDIAYLSKERGSCNISYAFNGSNDFHLLNSNGLAHLREGTGELILLFHKMQEHRYLLWQNKAP